MQDIGLAGPRPYHDGTAIASPVTMPQQPFVVFRRNVPPCPHLRQFVQHDCAEDQAQLIAAVDELEPVLLSYEQTRMDFNEKRSRLQDSMSRYDGTVDRTMAGFCDLDSLFERTGALQSASDEFGDALHGRGDARMAARGAVQRVGSLLDQINTESLGHAAREAFDLAGSELRGWMDRLSEAHPPVAYSMLPIARWRRIA